MPSIRCVVCQLERTIENSRPGVSRAPRGWKVLRNQPHCPSCKRRAFALRAVIVPVAKPDGASWAELRAHLRSLWIETTRCANWMVSELYARDVRRGPHDEKLPPMPYVYLYPEARALFPSLSSQALAALAQDIQRQYRARRSELLWFRSASLPSYKYPVGLTVPTQAWSLEQREGRWAVSLRLGAARWVLVLRGGPGMQRQSRRLAQLAAGEAERGSVTIYEAAAPGPSHRDAATAGGTRIMVKIAAWLPNAAVPEGSSVIHARTASDALLASGPRWRIDPAPIRGVLAAEERRRKSILANLQIARAHSTRRRGGIERALRELSGRSQRRLAEACRTYASHLAQHAVKHRAMAVHYDDRVRSALPHFPWEQLRRRIAEKLEEHGIGFVHINGVATADTHRRVAREGGGEHAA